MTDGVTQSAKDQDQPAIDVTDSKIQTPEIQPAKPIVAAQLLTIWTPRFIIIFGLALVVGLSTAALLTEGWTSKFFVGEWVLLAYMALLAGGWIALLVWTRSPWIRIGATFGGLWTILMSISYILSLLTVDPQSPIIAHLNAATTSALLGAYICLSINRTSLRLWDNLFFRFAPMIGAGIAILIFLLMPAENRSLSSFESIIAGVMFYLCVLVWWLRRSCWQTQPGPTFLFGIAPVIQLLLAIPGVITPDANFFFTQVMLLSILLGILRIIQSERILSKARLADDALHCKDD
ncbi:MAG TPA: hypothetical protein VFU49_03845 [Ktedonobacteraceae bacterium]|nr:hypothetical protein [Ktedonobacteraceae bacterium]